MLDKKYKLLNWKFLLNKEFKKKYFIKIKKFLIIQLLKKKKFYPPTNKIFNALKYTKFKNIKVVIIGQDPYFKKKLANGLAFAINPYIKNIPPTLKNIYKELEFEYNIIINKNLNLKNWAKQGVLLLNRILTVEENKSKSHNNIGWQIFTTFVIKLINFYHKKIIFLLWGNEANKFNNIININKHYIFSASHPSPLSVNKGFYKCLHFKKTNLILKSNNINCINWFL